MKDNKYQCLGLNQQDKYKIRDENELLIDMHFHLRKRPKLSHIVDRLAESVDIVFLTNRGISYPSNFEYDFPTFIKQAEKEGLLISQPDSRMATFCTDKEKIIVVKAQEIYTAEKYDVSVLGMEENIPNRLSYTKVCLKALESMTILGTPLICESSLSIRSIEDKQLQDVAKLVDAVEIYNPNSLPYINHQTQKLVDRIKVPGITCSDAHKYSLYDLPLNQSCIITYKTDIDTLNTLSLISTLKRCVAGGNFTRYKAPSVLQILETFSLPPTDLYRFFRGVNID